MYYHTQKGFGLGFGRSISRGVKILLITNGAVFVLQLIVGFGMTKALGLTPAYVWEKLAFYQLVTYMFLHGGFFHILINMFILWMFGPEIEFSWGTKAFFRYYFLTGIAGGIFTLLFQPHSAIPTIGASAAIYGLLVAYALMFPNRLIYLYFLVPVKVKYAVIFFVGLEFIASLSTTQSGIGHLAHLGGAVVGFIYLKLDWRVKTMRRRFSVGRHIRNLRYKHQSTKLEKNRKKAEEIMRRVDEILDKINEVGIENISEEERQFLGDASEMLSKNKE